MEANVPKLMYRRESTPATPIVHVAPKAQPKAKAKATTKAGARRGRTGGDDGVLEWFKHMMR